MALRHSAAVCARGSVWCGFCGGSCRSTFGGVSWSFVTLRPFSSEPLIGTSMVFVPFLASFGPQGGPVWHHLDPRATPFGALGTHGVTWSKSSIIKRTKNPERLIFGDPFLDTFSPKSCKVSPQRLPWNRACQNAFNWCLS